MLTVEKPGAEARAKAPRILCYEDIRLLPEAGSSAGNKRLFSRKAMDRSAFIRYARPWLFA